MREEAKARKAARHAAAYKAAASRPRRRRAQHSTTAALKKRKKMARWTGWRSQAVKRSRSAFVPPANTGCSGGHWDHWAAVTVVRRELAKAYKMVLEYCRECVHKLARSPELPSDNKATEAGGATPPCQGAEPAKTEEAAPDEQAASAELASAAEQADADNKASSEHASATAASAEAAVAEEAGKAQVSATTSRSQRCSAHLALRLRGGAGSPEPVPEVRFYLVAWRVHRFFTALRA
jgi:hypothetical protein